MSRCIGFMLTSAARFRQRAGYNSPDVIPPPTPTDPRADRLQRLLDGVTDFFRGYFWFIFKNVMGWILMLAAFPIGVIVPGPGGLPLFLIGFALVTFPGKRELTSRVMRGRGLPLDASIFTFLTAFVSIGLTCSLMWIISDQYQRILEHFNIFLHENDSTYTALGVALVGVGLIALLVTWVITRLGLQVLNFFLRRAPAVRRFIRPWLRRRGINILPARRKNRLEAANDEILEFSVENRDRVRSVWQFLRPWVRRGVSVGITSVIVWKMLIPLRRTWPEVRTWVDQITIPALLVGMGMFAMFLLLFRALVWRRILVGFGHCLPTAPAVRIWITSELARYLPGSFWQMIGRVFLVRPYGVTATVCASTQVLELCIFLLANAMVAVGSSIFLGIQEFVNLRIYLYAALAIVPAMALLLHPRIFYTLVNYVLARLGKVPITRHLSGTQLGLLLVWTIFGLFWQGLAVFLIMRPLFGMEWQWLWMVTGAYCLAWCGGFLAFWMPGGLGVREGVFVLAMQIMLPPGIKAQAHFQDTHFLAGLLVFVSFVLRFWTVLAELLLTIVVYLMDLPGVLGDSRAPGRVDVPPNEEDETDSSRRRAFGARRRWKSTDRAGTKSRA